MADSSARERELERALIDLTISAAPFATGRGMRQVRANLSDAIKRAADAIKAKPCERDRRMELVDLANAADEERRNDPCYRADLDG